MFEFKVCINNFIQFFNLILDNMFEVATAGKGIPGVLRTPKPLNWTVDVDKF